MIGTTAYMSLKPSGLGVAVGFLIFSLNGEE
jgi:hypothetical protein